jgi:hypothetical protein
MLRKDYNRKCSAEKKNAGRESQGAWRQVELIGGKLTLTMYDYECSNSSNLLKILVASGCHSTCRQSNTSKQARCKVQLQQLMRDVHTCTLFSCV